MIKGNMLIGQSGGPTSVINASLVGAITEGMNNPNIEKIYGAINGVAGVLSENFYDFSHEAKEDLEILKITPGAALGSVRYYLPDFTSLASASNDYHQLALVFKKYNIRYFYYIGGNDSMDTCNKIARYLKLIDYEAYVIGIPKTIDNDLAVTDHTPGYGSAIKYVATTLSQIYLDTNSYKEGRVTVVEIMGRDAGWLAAGAKLSCLNGCEPDLIYLPECAFDVDTFLKDVARIYEEKRKVLVAVGEGIRTKDGEYILKYRHFKSADSFGHLQLGGVAQVLCEIVGEHLHLPVRSVELNLPQRCSSCILSKADVDEAYEVGRHAVIYSTKGITDKMVIMKRVNNIIEYDVTEIKNVAKLIKQVPTNFINEEQNHITDEFIEYALPLIQGEIQIPFENGVPKIYRLKR